MKATIIAYRNASDIDVQFENGEIVTRRTFGNFGKGAISCPSLMNTKDRLGETKMMNCGMKATIVKYNNASDIDIRFEDDTIVFNRKYAAFRKGEILNPTIYASRLNETKLMKCGMQAQIIAYRKSNDIDVKFEDGTIVQHRSYSDFKKLSISNPNLHEKKTKVNS